MTGIVKIQTHNELTKVILSMKMMFNRMPNKAKFFVRHFSFWGGYFNHLDGGTLHGSEMSQGGEHWVMKMQLINQNASTKCS